MRELGIRLLLTVPNAASAPVFLNKLGWKPLPPLRVWARLRLRLRRPRGKEVERFTAGRIAYPGGRDRVLRDSDWLNWRFADSPTAYTLVEGEGYARRRAPRALRRRRGRRGRAPAGRGCRDAAPES